MKLRGNSGERFGEIWGKLRGSLGEGVGGAPLGVLLHGSLSVDSLKSQRGGSNLL